MNLKNECRSAVTSASSNVQFISNWPFGVLMVVLIGVPTEFLHVIADFRDDVISPHQGLLIVSLLALSFASEILAPSASIKKNSASTPVLTRMPCRSAWEDKRLQDGTRPLRDRLLLHHQIAGHQATSLRHGSCTTAAASGMANMSGCAGVMSSQVAKPAKPMLLPHFRYSRRRHQLGTLRSEQVGGGNHEIAILGVLSQSELDLSTRCHLFHLMFTRSLEAFAPGDPTVPGERHPRHRGSFHG